MLERILVHIHNWFEHEVYTGEWEVTDGSLDLPFLLEGQYFRVVGSIFNNGLHKYPVEGLQNEKFKGEIWALAIPNELMELAEEIEEWNAKYGQYSLSPYQSESFGGYTYSKGSGSSDSVSFGGWQEAFKSRLNPWRKLS